MTFHCAFRLLITVMTCLVAGCHQPQKSPTAIEQKVDALIAKIDENPDILHSDYTPAVSELVRIGEPALPMVLPLMEHANEMTRLRASHVLEIVTMEMHGFSWGHGWNKEGGEAKWRAFWHSLGDLRYDASLAERQTAMRLWYEWIRTRKKPAA